MLAVPAAAAQQICDQLVAAGVTSILNFAPVVLSVPVARRRAQGRPGRRAADPVVPREPQGRSHRPASSPNERRSTEPADERAGGGAVAPDGAGVGARVGDRAGRRVAKLLDELARDRVDQRGAAALDLQPGRGLRRRRPVPPGAGRHHRGAVAPLRARRSPSSATTSTSTSPRRRPSTSCRSRPGLDSMVVGESQILGQLRAAYQVCTDAGIVGTVLHELAQTALRVGKRVHTETGIDRVGASVVSVALDHADGHARIGLDGRRALIVGAGSMAALAGATLRRAGRRRASWSSTGRRPTARGWPSRSAAGSPTSTRWRTRSPRADLVVSRDRRDPDRDRRRARGRRARDRPLVLLDLALPRDVDPAVGRARRRHVRRPRDAAGRRIRRHGRERGRRRRRPGDHRRRAGSPTWPSSSASRSRRP